MLFVTVEHGHQWEKDLLMLLILLSRDLNTVSCSPGETDSVPREAEFSSVWRSAMVDHLAVHPAGVTVVGTFGFPSLEGRIQEPDRPFPG